MGESGTAVPAEHPEEVLEQTWRLRPRQFVAVVALAILLVAQIVWAVISFTSNELDRRQLLNQETDIAGLIFTQRESLLVLQRLDSWTLNEATARDVQIARANLARRLSVVPSSGIVTAELVGEPYLKSLAELDDVIRGLSDVEEEDRIAFRQNSYTVIRDFDRDARGLSTIFQRVLGEQSEELVRERTEAEIIYVGLLGLSTGFLALVTVWISSDIRQTYRRTSLRLSMQTEELRRATERLLLMSSLERGAADISEKVSSKVGSEEVLVLIRDLATSLLPGDEIRMVTYSGRPSVKSVQSDAITDDDDRTIVLERLDELCKSLYDRDSTVASLSYLATHDDLTGLVNRSSYTLKVNERILESDPRGPFVLVVAVDIDRFGELNSALGFEAGDTLLIEVAERLSDISKGQSTVARVAADEFAVVCESHSKEEAEERARAIHDHLRFTTVLAGVESTISCATAAVLVQDPEKISGDIVGQVGGLLRLAKEQGEGGFLFFNPEVHGNLGENWLDDRELQRALRDGEFVLHFQPIVQLPSGDVAGFESLLRWEKPGVGLIFPGKFLPGVDRAGLTLDLGRKVVEHALLGWKRSLREIQAGAPPYVAINVDPKQLLDDSFAEYVLALTKRLEVPPSVVVLEVTEGAVTEGEVAYNQLVALRNGGIRVAIDDFGTGYSNLSQLHKLPVDIVKLDRSFLESIEEDYQSFGLISDVVRLAKRLNLTLVAEGIESSQMSEKLAGLGVTYGQGYLYSPALPESEVKTWFRARHTELQSASANDENTPD